MYIVELTLKHTALPLSVHKKTVEAAEAAYQTVMTGIKSGQPITLELTCEKQEEKKIAVMVSEVAAVQIYEKSGSASSSGKAPGFFAMAAE